MQLTHILKTEVLTVACTLPDILNSWKIHILPCELSDHSFLVSTKIHFGS